MQLSFLRFLTWRFLIDLWLSDSELPKPFALEKSSLLIATIVS